MDDLVRSKANGRIIRTAVKGFDFACNAALTEAVSAVVTRCSEPIAFAFEPFEAVRRGFQIQAASRVSIAGHSFESAVGRAGYMIPISERWTIEHAAGFECLVLRFSMSALKEKLGALIGNPIDANITFEPAEAAGPAFNRLLWDAAVQFSQETDQLDHRLCRTAMLELQQQMAVRFLLLNRHSMSKVLEQPILSGREQQVRLMEEFIAANWDRPVDITEVARAAGISIRSAFRTFRMLRGCAPNEFVRNLRLDQARRLLMTGSPFASVTSVAYKCGFHGLGHFARAYRVRFGELPSQTLNNRIRS